MTRRRWTISGPSSAACCTTWCHFRSRSSRRSTVTRLPAAPCCDYRFMAEGQGRIGLNEVPVGIVIPTPIVELARHAVGDTRASDMIFHGALLFAEQAGAFGLVHATVPPEQLLERAQEKLL